MSVYYQLVNFIQEMPAFWFSTIIIVLFVVSITSVIKFFKAHNGTQKNFEKVGSIFLAVVLFAILLFLTYIRK